MVIHYQEKFKYEIMYILVGFLLIVFQVTHTGYWKHKIDYNKYVDRPHSKVGGAANMYIWIQAISAN